MHRALTIDVTALGLAPRSTLDHARAGQARGARRSTLDAPRTRPDCIHEKMHGVDREHTLFLKSKHNIWKHVGGYEPAPTAAVERRGEKSEAS